MRIGSLPLGRKAAGSPACHLIRHGNIPPDATSRLEPTQLLGPFSPKATELPKISHRRRPAAEAKPIFFGSLLSRELPRRQEGARRAPRRDFFPWAKCRGRGRAGPSAWCPVARIQPGRSLTRPSIRPSSLCAACGGPKFARKCRRAMTRDHPSRKMEIRPGGTTPSGSSGVKCL